jgi:hypothetical protein
MSDEATQESNKQTGKKRRNTKDRKKQKRKKRNNTDSNEHVEISPFLCSGYHNTVSLLESIPPFAILLSFMISQA